MKRIETNDTPESREGLAIIDLAGMLGVSDDTACWIVSAICGIGNAILILTWWRAAIQ